MGGHEGAKLSAAKFQGNTPTLRAGDIETISTPRRVGRGGDEALWLIKVVLVGEV